MTAVSAGGLEPIRGSLGPRDWAVLSDLARLRLLTTRQVERLHVADGSSLTRARRARALMQRLHALGLVTHLDRRVGGVHAGSAGHVYGLAAKGQRLTNDVGPAGGRRFRKPWEPSALFTDHILAVSELYVRLRELEAAKHIEDLVFQAEPACWRTWTGAGGERLIVKPDAFVGFAHGDYDYRYFVEVDRASQSRTVIRRKGEVYIDYYRSGREQTVAGLFPRVLFVTPSIARSSQIVDALGKLDAEHWQLFQVQTEHEAFDIGVDASDVNALRKRQHL